MYKHAIEILDKERIRMMRKTKFKSSTETQEVANLIDELGDACEILKKAVFGTGKHLIEIQNKQINRDETYGRIVNILINKICELLKRNKGTFWERFLMTNKPEEFTWDDCYSIADEIIKALQIKQNL